MPFNPDEYLKATDFNPDAYLAQDATPKEAEAPIASLEGTAQASKSALSGAAHLAGAAPLRAALDTGVDSILKASGNLFVDENPYKDTSVGELHNQNLATKESQYQAAKETAPIAYGGGQLALSAALPGRTAGQLVTQGLSTAATESQGQGLDKVKDIILGGGIAGAVPLVAKGLSKMGQAIMDSKYGRAFRGGGDVQKFTNPDAQKDLANRATQALDDTVSGATKSHAEARQAFTQEVGPTPVIADDVSARLKGSIDRYGPDAEIPGLGTVGALSAKEKEELLAYAGALEQPLSAQELYKVWDRLKTRADFNDPYASSEFNTQLKSLMGGIKEKIHALSPDMQAADASMTNLMDDVDQLRALRTEKGNESFLSTIGGRTKGNRRDALDATLSDHPDMLKEFDDFQTWKSFEGQGGFGSMEGLKNAGGIAVGSALGYSQSNDSVGGAVGGIVGGALSRGQNQRALITKAGDIYKSIGLSTEKIGTMAPKFQGLLKQAAERGGRSLAITHFLLNQSDPEYQQEVSSEKP